MKDWRDMEGEMGEAGGEIRVWGEGIGEKWEKSLDKRLQEHGRKFR